MDAVVRNPSVANDQERAEFMYGSYQQLVEEISKRIVGQQEVVELLLTSMFAGGHSLLVGVPGLAKTMLISTLAEVLDLKFARVQFTPDLMPADITGTDVLVTDTTTGDRSFRFVPGPIFTNVLLADEINRSPPKTQAALLQSMQEQKVTAGANTHELPQPYLVFATQNPIEQEGTYPLPEAELDRFMFYIGVDYPSSDEERTIVRDTTDAQEPVLNKILGPKQIQEFQNLVRRVPVANEVLDYAVRLVRASRPAESSASDMVKQYVSWGAGPRASQYLVLGGKVRALLQGRFAVSADDIRAMARPVLRHRIIANFHAEVSSVTSVDLVENLIEVIKP